MAANPRVGRLRTTKRFRFVTADVADNTDKMRKSTLPRLLTLLCFSLLLLGCSRGGPEVVLIEGTVTHNGEPVPSLRVYFVPTDGRPSWAISDQNGHFKLDYDAEHT